MRTLSKYLGEKPLYKDRRRVKKVTEKFSDLNFVQRAKNPENYPNLTDKFGNEMTHKLAAEKDRDGNWYVFPTIVYDKKTRKLVDIQPKEGEFPKQAWDYAEKTGERIPFGKKKKFAIKYSQNGLIDHSQDSDETWQVSSPNIRRHKPVVVIDDNRPETFEPAEDYYPQPTPQELNLEKARKYYSENDLSKIGNRNKKIAEYLRTGKWPKK